MLKSSVSLSFTSALASAFGLNHIIIYTLGKAAELNTWFELIVLFYMDSLSKTRSRSYIKVHEAKKALIKDISLVNRVHLTVLVTVENIHILCIA